MILFCGLAILASLRVAASPRVVVCVLAANLLIMTKSHVAWDKYILPMLLILWMVSLHTRSAESEESP